MENKVAIPRLYKPGEQIRFIVSVWNKINEWCRAEYIRWEVLFRPEMNKNAFLNPPKRVLSPDGPCYWTDLVILSVQDMVMSCSPCSTPSQVWTGPRHRTGTVPSPDSILVRRWLRCFLMRCLLLCTENMKHICDTVSYSDLHKNTKI